MPSPALRRYLSPISHKEWVEVRDCINGSVEEHIDLSPGAPYPSHQREAVDRVLKFVFRHQSRLSSSQSRDSKILRAFILHQASALRQLHRERPSASQVSDRVTPRTLTRSDESSDNGHLLVNLESFRSNHPRLFLPQSFQRKGRRHGATSGLGRDKPNTRSSGHVRPMATDSEVEVVDLTLESDSSSMPPQPEIKDETSESPLHRQSSPITIFDEGPEQVPFESNQLEVARTQTPRTETNSTGRETLVVIDANVDELLTFLSTCEPPLIHLHSHLVAYGYDMKNLEILAKREVMFIRKSIDGVRELASMKKDLTVRPIDWDHLEYHVCMLRRGD